MRYVHLFVILLCFATSLYPMGEQRLQQNINKDSLQNKTLRELTILFWRGEKLDSVSKIKIRDVYIEKAKALGNEVYIADGYQMFLHLFEGDYENYLKYSDSIIRITQDLKISHYQATGYIFRGSALQEMGRYNEALESFLKAKKYAESNNFETQLIDAEDKIAELKLIIGKDLEALDIYKKHFLELSKKKDLRKDSEIYIYTLYMLGSSYNRIKKYDSAYFYLKKGIKYSLANYYHRYYPELVFTTGVNNYYRNRYNSSIDSLQKVIRLLDRNKDKLMVRMSYLYLAKNYKELGEDNRAIEYLQKVDSITNLSNYRLEIREVFELLKDYYSKKKNKTELLLLLEKWIKYEKFREKQYNKLDQEIIEKYDFPKLINENEKYLVQVIDKKNKVSIYRIIVFGCIIIIVISALYFLLYKRKKNKLEIVLDEQFKKVKVLENNNKISSSANTKEISDLLKVEILNKLKVFELNKEYLKNNLTLVKASKKMKTNSTYLSKVINIEKKKNFTNYINDLRIDYCVEQIKTNKQFRQYSISSMANEVGFNNIQSFAKAFSKKNGCNPAEYIKKLQGID